MRLFLESQSLLLLYFMRQDQSECEDGGEEDQLADDTNGVGALLGLDLDSLLKTFATEDTQVAPADAHEGGGNQAADRRVAGPVEASAAGRSNVQENDDVNIDLQPGEAIVPVR